MAIYRGDGGAGDATNDITINQITELSSDAQAAAAAAASSATSASTSAGAASTSATNAANSATAASTSETNAASSATSAASSATNAASSETNAAASETAAAASETAAGLSETAAAASETNAATSATNAATSATNASTSATSASSSASSASTSATNASTSETNAASSASAAATSATNADSSATSASNDAATATTKASEASTSASNAATSETNAAASESAAATSATNASTSETNAAASETAAASSASAASTSATNAATSASGAATSASSAATSASNASASADAALSALDNFDDRYLGQKTSDPTTDNDGDALVAGALYFNTTSDVMKVYEGSTWVAAYASLAGALLVSNNLSDLDNVSTARTNLGLGTAATTASTDYVAVTGDTMTGDLFFGDNDKAIFGAGSDLQIYHTGGHSFISDQGTGELRILATDLRINNSASNKSYLRAIDGGALTLYHNGSSKLATTNTGVNVTGTVTADGLDISDANPIINFTDTTNNFDAYISAENGNLELNSDSNNESGSASTMSFKVDNTERMRITSSGDLLVGKTATNLSTDGIELKANNTAYFTRSAAPTVYINRNTSDGAIVVFRRSNSTVGTISVTTTATAYNTSSDYRLKEDLQPIVGASDRVKALNPINFAWKSNGERVDGFLAHEAQEVVPEAVSGTKDAVQLWEEGDELPEGVVVGDNKLDDDGNTIPEYQGIDQSKLVPLLTSALQEAIGRIETLEAEVTALKG